MACQRAADFRRGDGDLDIVDAVELDARRRLVVVSGAADYEEADAGSHVAPAVPGADLGEGVGADLLGHPLNSLVWLAGSSVAAAFDGLQAGQVILLGSVTPPIWLTGPASVTVEFPPLPPVQVRLT